MIEVNGLTKYYGEWPAVQDLTFSVPKGQVLGFLGPNGAGKSTTMRMLTGYISATEGTAQIGGYDVFQNPLEVRRQIGYLPELTPLYEEMRVRDYLTFMCKIRGVPRSRRQQRIEYVLSACGLEERHRDIIGRLSKGLRQRVGLAQAVVHEPDLLILDEPTSGLDIAQRRETREMIREIGKQHTVILSSHVLAEVSATCERVLIINRGRLVADDSTENLARRGASQGQVELTVRGPAEAVRTKLLAVRGVVEATVEKEADGQAQLLVTSGEADVRELLAKAVVGAKYGLLEMRERRVSLEDVFLQLTADADEEYRAEAEMEAAAER